MANSTSPRSTTSSAAERSSTTLAASPTQSESPVIVSTQLSLSQAVYERREEYTRSQRMRIKIGTWNVAALAGTEKDLGSWFVDGKGVSEAFSGISLKDNEGEKAGEPESLEAQERRRSKNKPTVPKNDTGALPGGEEIGMYILGLQEIVDISSAGEALRPFYDPNPGRKWKQAVMDGLPRGYYKVAEQQLLGLYLLVFASHDLHQSISSVSTTSVGTGLMGYMGNKGAVTARIILGETTRIVFVNCHLSAGHEKGSLERRNWDAGQILSRTKFEPIHKGNGVIEEFGESIGEEDFAFWFGDLNYRLDNLPPEDVRRLLMLHTENAYNSDPPSTSVSKQKIERELSESQFSIASDSSSQDTNGPESTSISARIAGEPSTSHPEVSSSSLSEENSDPAMDPTSLQATLSSLFPHDQLYNQMQEGKAFHDGWREGSIKFLPTYKYDIGSVGMFDSSEKRRGPSWCDRILYRTRRDKLDYDEKVRAEEAAKKKDEEMKLRGVVEAAADEAVLFDYDPETDGADYDGTNEGDAQPEVVTTKAGFEDKIKLEHYTSHQRVLSSDHKPLDAIFILDYDSVDPDLKAQVYQEVARELDKAENDGRPNVTVLVDQHRQSDSVNVDSSASASEGVDFGNVKYDQPKTRTLTIANTGGVPATVGFVDRSVSPNQQGGIAPSWVSLRFDRPSDNQNLNPGALLEYTIQPGDAANVELTLNVDHANFISKLNEGEETLEDVLVLRIHNGRDYFIPLRATWLQSILGRSIEKLVRLPEGGVRKLQSQRPEGSSSGEGDADKDGVKWSAPRELFRLTEAIESLLERAVGEWEMTGKDRKDLGGTLLGWPFIAGKDETQEQNQLKIAVRDALDTDTPFNEIWPAESSSLHRLEAVASTLLLFLTTLTDGVITSSLWTSIENRLAEHEKHKTHLSQEEERTWILDALSTAPVHSVCFTFITFTLSRAANEIAPLRTVGSPPVSPSAAFQEAFNNQLREEDEKGIRRKQVESAYAALFSTAMVRIPESVVGKARKLSEKRATHVLEVFLRGYGQ